MDILSEVIAAVRTGRPSAVARALTQPWGLRWYRSSSARFHVVLQGSAELMPGAAGAGGQAPGDASLLTLAPGDIVLLPHGQEHALAGDGGMEWRDVMPVPDGVEPHWPPTTWHTDGIDAVIMTGTIPLDLSRAHPLFAQLPPVIHLRRDLGVPRSLGAAVELLAIELEEAEIGWDTIVAGLLDTVLLYILRAWWLRERPGSELDRGWAAALRDPAVGAALQAIHRQPALSWTVEKLAAESGLSRAVFAQRFTTMVGSPPVAYLTWWRMTQAGRLLLQDHAPLQTIAERVGYASEFAFARAFKRDYGIAPGLYRARGRQLI
ncbi:AraC family transcriptional regulator [Streptomyces sp. NPDC090088]|uniref:AraC family transcriptional regulator n=1 Tax=Streptomyces sp. NPDC090088 TaxID=3365944 RepID=UPI0037FDA5FA